MRLFAGLAAGVLGVFVAAAIVIATGAIDMSARPGPGALEPNRSAEGRSSSGPLVRGLERLVGEALVDRSTARRAPKVKSPLGASQEVIAAGLRHYRRTAWFATGRGRQARRDRRRAQSAAARPRRGRRAGELRQRALLLRRQVSEENVEEVVALVLTCLHGVPKELFLLAVRYTLRAYRLRAHRLSREPFESVSRRVMNESEQEMIGSVASELLAEGRLQGKLRKRRRSSWCSSGDSVLCPASS